MDNKLIEIRRLAGYYRDLLGAISQQSGKHLVDMGSTLRYGLTVDIGHFVKSIRTVIENDILQLALDRMSPELVTSILLNSEPVEDEVENNEDNSQSGQIIETNDEKKMVSAKVMAIYRKQEQDRYNRETIIGFPVVAGKFGNKKICAPLFYIPVNVEYNPLKSTVILSKNVAEPVFNSSLIAKLVSQDGEVELVRQKLLPVLYEEEFSLEVIEKSIKILGELVEALRGLKVDGKMVGSLKSAIDARETKGLRVFNAIVLVNAARGNAFLIDELLQLAELNEFHGETVISSILGGIPENVGEQVDDPDHESHNRPLLFPLKSNQAQRRAARKAEKAKLISIQGPPGTGKSQTIANLVCDLVAQGKTILVTSHQNKALEVITDKLPEVDYLALSLLKGEKASAEQLANQLANFDTYVADISSDNLNRAYERTIASIQETDADIRRLKARFSELKCLERDSHSKYYRFYEIKEYDHISKEDVLPEGSTLLKSYTQWYQIYKKTKVTTKKQAGFLNKLKLYADYTKIFLLEKSALGCLQKTLEKIKNLDFENEPEWVRNFDKAIEAYRLSKFIDNDIVENPDDIGEISSEIRKMEANKRELATKALYQKIKIALKKAATDNATSQQIIKLKKILSRKRKTVSFVQLKEKVDYRKLLNVFPCWVMSIEDVARIFPLQEGLFDYLIVDEASQCNQATALHLAYRAKRMIVVGDQKQMKNPNVRFLSDDLVRMLLVKHELATHPKVDFFHGRESLLALVEYSANSREFLNEHFRCEPPIIAWSNKEFYNNKLKVLTPIRPRRFKPSLEVNLVHGADDDPDIKQNILEAQAVIRETARLIESGEAEGLTIGVMSLYREQATLLQKLLFERIERNPEWLKKHDLIVSTADGFQGDERDIILYSMRYGPSSSPGTINAIQLEPERINVAFSRARRKMIMFISRPVEEFPKGIIRDFLRHADAEYNNPSDRLGLVSDDKFDSKFEEDVCFALRQRNITVYTQVPCASFKIDMVAIDNEGRRIAIECDGEFHYDDDGDLREEDYQRQDIIERSGWYVHRIPVRKYYMNPYLAIDQVIDVLKLQPTDEQIEVEIIKKPECFDLEAVDQRPSSLKKVDFVKPIEQKPGNTGSPKEVFNKATNNQPVQPTSIDLAEPPLTEPIWKKEAWLALYSWGRDFGRLTIKEYMFCNQVAKVLGSGKPLVNEEKKAAVFLWNEALSKGFSIKKPIMKTNEIPRRVVKRAPPAKPKVPFKPIAKCLDCRKFGTDECTGPNTGLGSYDRQTNYCPNFSRKKRIDELY